MHFEPWLTRSENDLGTEPPDESKWKFEYLEETDAQHVGRLRNISPL